jgi:outer membrane receptor protein involved in Fe transport
VTIPAEDLRSALNSYIRQTGVQLFYRFDDVNGLVSHAVSAASPIDALTQLLDGTGVVARRDRSGAIVIFRPQVNDDTKDGENSVESVVVTGSRIEREDNLSPTPVQHWTSEELQRDAPGSIPEALDKMPIFMAGSTPNNAVTGANGRGNNAPGYFLNLRDLGTIRTLILEDGHRVPGTFYDTTVDTDMLPQMLVQRVEVVTGGASAVYGSDAVTGVVNFILDTKFEGLKGIFDGGMSGHADARNFRLGLAGGEDIGSRGHLVWSIEFKDRDAITNDGARPLGLVGSSIVGAGTAASPYNLVYGIRQANTAPGGLIVSPNSPGYGMQFLSNGNLGPFNPGTPTATANFDIGGDGGITHNEYLLPVSNTAQAFAHYTYEFNSSITGYIEARYAMARSYEESQIFTNINGTNTLTPACTPVNGVCTNTPIVGYNTNGSGAQYPITIYSGNAFLTPAEQAFLFPTGGATSFQMSRMDNDLMSRLSLDQHTGALAVSAGLKGTIFDGYNWEFNYTHGETRTQLTTRNNVNTAKFYAAIDAVRDPTTGSIVCNVSITAPGAFPGCVPLNLFGQGSPGVNSSNASQAALNYVGDTTAWVAHNGLDDFSADVTGTIFDDWAGPVKMAVGVEYRLAGLNVTTTTPNDTFNPQYLRLAPPGTFASTTASPTGTFPAADLSEFKEVQSGAQGAENVSEANVELDLPLLKDLPGIEMLSANGAARYTRYAVGGVNPQGNGVSSVNAAFSATTWKIGTEWWVFEDLKARGSYSRDIRAPTLFDLFQGPLTTTSGVSDSLTGVSGSANTSTIGNPNLKPEVARNTTAGIIYTPSWLQGFGFSADYFHIKIDNEIAAISGNNAVVQSLCLASPGGSSPYCALIQRPISYNSTAATNFPTLYLSQAQNAQIQWSEGADFELDYTNDLSDWTGLNGVVSLRALWSHTTFLKTVLNLPGSVITDIAGAAAPPASSLPADKAAFTLGYSNNGLSVNILERYYSPLRQNANPTLIYNIPNLPAYFLTDLNVAFDLAVDDQPVTAFLNVSNLFDKQPDILQAPGYTGSPGLNYPVVNYEDIIGRAYTVGFKLKM